MQLPQYITSMYLEKWCNLLVMNVHSNYYALVGNLALGNILHSLLSCRFETKFHEEYSRPLVNKFVAYQYMQLI